MTTDDTWRSELGATFAGLVPEPSGDDRSGVDGRIDGAALGDLRTYRVTGTPQIVRRTPRAVRMEPTEALKVCLQVRGRAIVHQGDRELVIGPGQFGVYDTRRAYDLRLDGDWECAVLVFAPDALAMPSRWLDTVMTRVYDASSGPGTVLAPFVSASLDGTGAEPVGSRVRFGDAGLRLLCSALSSGDVDGRADDDTHAQAQRLSIVDYIRRHLADPSLSHRTVAHAHGMSPRTLDRLFHDEGRTVATTVRTMRLEAARRDVLDTRSRTISIAAVAARWCFLDPAYFSRIYKQQFGISPSADRASLRSVA